MTEKSLVLLKPDTLMRGLVGEILTRFEKCGLKIVGMKMVYPTEKLAGEHYAVEDEWLISVGKKQKSNYLKKGINIDKSDKELGEQIRQYLIDYLVMSPIIALVFEGHNAVEHIRKLVGTTSPQNSAPGTIRGDYSFDTYSLADKSKRPIQNLIHASSEVKEAEREIKLWFTNEELHTWKRLDEELIYRIGN